MSEEDYGYEEYDDEVEYYAVRPNKTQIKKDIAALFKLAEEMSALSAGHLASFELPEKIHKAVTEVAGMPLNGARKRLLKFIAGQLHKIDVTPYQEKMARIKTQSAHVVREHHIIERWRDRLLNEGQEALTELMDDYPHADRQQLRHLMRNAQKEAAQGATPKSSRSIYQYLKVLFSSNEEEIIEEGGFDDEEPFDDDGVEIDD